jgi:glycosyltransferase involved in cell wall biosynthesis
MRIALISTAGNAIPPVGNGSIELTVGLLAEGFVERGHDVTVFAPGASRVAGRLVSVFERGYVDDETIWDWQLADTAQVAAALERAAEFDVISSHAYCSAVPFGRLVSTPLTHTFHIGPTPDWARLCALYAEGHYILVSEPQRELLPVEPAAVIPNGIDTSAFPFSAEPGRYLVFLGSFTEDKAPLAAIRLAREAGVPIRLAGPDSDYYRELVAPEVDGVDVEYVGEVGHDEKAELLRDALALVFPSEGFEAFGLVLVEAMACGTPVLARPRGAAPELVEEGVTGFLAEDFSQLAPRVGELAALDRTRIRQIAEERFDAAHMVERYLELFAQLTGGASPRP